MNEELKPQAGEPAEGTTPDMPGPAEAAGETLPAAEGQAEEMEDAPAPDDTPRIFGMPAVVFRSIAVGFAGGLMLTGLLGVLGIHFRYLPIIVCAAIGWLVGKRLDKRRDAQK